MISLSKNTKIIIAVGLTIFFFGGWIVASGKGFGEFFSYYWAKFISLLGGNIE